MAEHVRIVEVCPRDGLQNESRLVPLSDKIMLVDLLSGCGFERIEVTSFVSPKWVPQLADAAEVMAGIARRPGTRYTALTPNLEGYQRAKAARADEVAVFAAASEAFSRQNINCGIAESIERFRPLAAAAGSDGIPLRGYVSCVTHCPYEGKVMPAQVASVARALSALGCHEISLGDTIGEAQPDDTKAMLIAVLDEVPVDKLAGHFHDTRSRALANIAVCLDHGLRVFDASAGGLGGCPYAPGAAGNVATEAVARFLEARGLATGLDMEALDRAAAFARSLKGSHP